MHTASYLLLAAMDDWLQIIVPVVLFVFWVISQVTGAGKPKPGPQRRRVNPGDRAGQGGLMEEVEALLHRVQNPEADVEDELPAEIRREAIPAHAVEADVVESPTRTERLSAFDRSANSPFAASVDEAGQAEPRRNFPDFVPAASEALADHHLGHRHLGTLEDTSDGIHGPSDEGSGDEEGLAASGLDVPTTASEVRAMFSRPEGMRKAVVLSEVLSRPEWRWGGRR